MTDTKAANQLKEKNLWITVLLLAILASGSLFAWWMAARADREMRTDLLRQTRQVALALNIQNIKAISDTKIAINSPVYLSFQRTACYRSYVHPSTPARLSFGPQSRWHTFPFWWTATLDSKNHSLQGQVSDEVFEWYRSRFCFQN